jgi:hypothetical protein
LARPLRSRRPAWLLALTAIVVGILFGPAAAKARAHESVAKPDVGDTYETVRGLGPTKRAAKGLLRVKLRDDTTVVTHGLDPQPDAPERAVDFAGPERSPVCASDYYQHVLYGYPNGAPNRIASVKATIQAEIRRMDALLNEEALASGGKTADYKVLCDDVGEIRVDVFQSTQSDQQTSFSGVVSAARDAGYDASNADYTIFFDSAVPSACGTGTYSDDQRLTAENANNSGGDYAVVYSDCWTDRTAMHENGHNQGAVQYDAPYSTGSGAHCNDGYDIMCYSDGGDRDVGMTTFCTDKMRFDCRHDTYFDTAPAPGSYLAGNWNLGSPLNRFVVFDDDGVREPTCQDGIDNDGDGRTDYPADLGCTGAGDTYETDLPACLDLRDNDGDGRKDFPLDPGCSSVLDNDESDPAREIDFADEEPEADEAPVARRLPTLTMAAARRYARRRIKRKSPSAKSIKASCARRTRTSATCKVRWKTAKRAGYRGKMVVRYRFRGSRAALVATSTLRRFG